MCRCALPDGTNPFKKLVAGVRGAGNGYMTATTLSMLIALLYVFGTRRLPKLSLTVTLAVMGMPAVIVVADTDAVDVVAQAGAGCM